MNKVLLFIVFFCVFISSVSSMNLDSLIVIKGYYIMRFERVEVESFYEEKIKKMNGESHSIAIDQNMVSYFIPTQIENKIFSESAIVSEKIVVARNLNKDSIYYIPTTKYVERYINIIFNKEVNLSKEVSIFQEINRSLPYYLDKKTEKYFYKCTYIEGKALTKLLVNSEENRFKIDLDIDAVNRESSKINIFFLISITNYTPYVNILGLEQWYPYLN